MTLNRGPKSEGMRLEDVKEDEILETDIKVDKVIYRLPDGGYGWVVVIASFLTHLIVDGLIYSYGVFLREFQIEFEVGTGLVAGLGSLLSGTCLLTAPFAAALINMYGCRKVVMTGSVLSFIGFLLSSMAPNFACMVAFFGVLAGIGFGLMFLPMVVIVSYYFDHKRAIATGIAVSGSGFGIFIIAPFCRWLLEIYGWRNCLLILAGVNLQGLVFGALLRPVAFAGVPEDLIMNDPDMDFNLDGLEPYFSRSERGSQMTVNNVERPNNDDDVSSRKPSEIEPFELNFLPMQRKDIFYSGSVLNLPEFLIHNNLVDYNRSILSVTKTLSLATINNKVVICGCIPVSQIFKDTIAQMTDVSLLKERTFALISLANFFVAMGTFIPFVYLTDKTLSLGFSAAQASLLLSIIGLCNTFGRFACGLLANLKDMNILLMHNVSVLLAGVSCTACTFITSYPLMCTFSVVFGLCFAFFVTISAPLLCNLLGLEKLTNAYGLIIMLRGIATLTGTPLAGILFDVFQDYNAPFHTGGLLIILGGFFSSLLHCLHPHRG